MAIKLTKGQKLNLRKDNGQKLENFYVGANWGMITKKMIPGGFIGRIIGAPEKEVKSAVDLDLAAILYDKDKNLVDTVFFNNLTSKGIRHSGDDLTGDETADENDNEVIEVRTKEIPPNVHYIIFTLNSYNGVKFDEIPYARIRLYEGTSPGNPKEVFATYEVNRTPEFSGKLSLILGALIKNENDGEWSFKAIGKATNDRWLSDIRENILKNFDKLILN